MKRIVIPGILAFALAAPAQAQREPVAPRAGGPLAQIQKTNQRIDRLLKSHKTGDDPAARAEMRDIAGGLLDFQELGRRSLAAHWETLSPAQREEFVKTFRDMIEHSYERRLDGQPDYKISYGDETVNGSEATVVTTVKVKTKGKSTEAEVDYKMKKEGERWVVYDIVTDDVSMAKTYREEFDKIIKQESFDALLKKMRKRAQETANGSAKKSTAG